MLDLEELNLCIVNQSYFLLDNLMVLLLVLWHYVMLMCQIYCGWFCDFDCQCCSLVPVNCVDLCEPVVHQCKTVIYAPFSHFHSTTKKILCEDSHERKNLEKQNSKIFFIFQDLLRTCTLIVWLWKSANCLFFVWLCFFQLLTHYCITTCCMKLLHIAFETHCAIDIAWYVSIVHGVRLLLIVKHVEVCVGPDPNIEIKVDALKPANLIRAWHFLSHLAGLAFRLFSKFIHMWAYNLCRIDRALGVH